MPRKIPTQVDQGLSRMLKGGFLKSQPTSYQTLLAYPPASLPPRAPFRQIPGDVPSLSARTKTSLEELTAKTGRDRMNSAKGTRSRMPKLFPQPIVYLADRVRERFYEDHPWETLRPRTLVEGSTVQEGKNISRDATSLEAWGKNPGPEE
jgi:small subunit ribosomal protein S23